MAIETANKLVIGNVGQDAVLRQTASGKDVCEFSVAESKYLGKNADGTSNTATTWYTCVAWEAQAREIAGKIKKGMKVCVAGTLKAEAYLNEAGEAKPKMVLKLDPFTPVFGALTSVGGKKNAAADDDSGYAPEPDDIPF